MKLSCRFIGRDEQSSEGEEPSEVYNGALPDAMQLEWYKKYKDKETRTLSAFKSLTFFALFMLVLGIVCYGSRNYYHYLMAEEVKAIFPRAEQASKIYSKCILFLIFEVFAVSLTLYLSNKLTLLMMSSPPSHLFQQTNFDIIKFSLKQKTSVRGSEE